MSADAPGDPSGPSAPIPTLDGLPPSLDGSLPSLELDPDEDPVSLEAPEDGPSLHGQESRYEVLKILGRGGMGVVYQARDRELERIVAIKTLVPGASNPRKILDFLNKEARTLASIDHPALPMIYDVLREDAQLTIVMEYVRGEPLDAILARHPEGIPVQSGASIWLQLLAALAYLHRRGLIHRDIKPGNLMLDKEGRLRLVDFGLARQVEQILRDGTRIRGTPIYMAPEQIQNLRLSAATDLYSAAVTMYELLTGRLPFPHTKTPGYHHLHTPPQPLRLHSPETPAALCAQIDACLQKRPVDRPLRAEDMIQELVEALQLLPAELPAPVRAELEPARTGSGAALVALESDTWRVRSPAHTAPSPLGAQGPALMPAIRLPPPLPPDAAPPPAPPPPAPAPPDRPPRRPTRPTPSPPLAEAPPLAPRAFHERAPWLARALMLGGAVFFGGLLLGALALLALWLRGASF
jgi:serine/threonine protein kinase